jgi:RHS repeat-associated protein
LYTLSRTCRTPRPKSTCRHRKANYDTLNRLAGATDNQSGNPSTNYCWGYDPFGNRTIQVGSPAAFTAGSPTCTPASGASFTSTWANYNANNQFTATSQALGGVPYDAAGNVLYDGVCSYLYDAEGRICAVVNTPVPNMTVMTGYIYGADGTRVAKGTITALSCDPAANGFHTINDYVLDPAGEQVTEMGMDANNSMAWQHTNVWAGGNLVATYDPDGLHFHLTDPLGTRRSQTDYAGVVEQTCSSLPFGDSLACTVSIQAPTEHHFTGKERDTESGNDYFEARYYSSSMGRFMSPDPANAGADPANPQSWNMYSYALNNPLNLIDPNGLFCVWDVGSYDSPDDPQTGSISQCSGPNGAGGTWYEGSPSDYGLSEDWSSTPNAGLAADVAAGQAAVDDSNSPIIRSDTWGGSNASSVDWGWWGAFGSSFATNFVSRSFYKQEFQKGGCLNTFVHATAEAANPLSSSPSVSSDVAGGAVAAVPDFRYNAALAYAASRTNVLGGQGLIAPWKSIPYNNILNGTATSTLAVGGLGYLDGALAQGFLVEVEQAANGDCQ